MGLLSILLGLALAGALADILVENHIATAAEQSVVVAGTTQQLSMPVLVAIAFGVGALALALVLLGIRRMRRGSRKKLHQRIQNLEDENARLHAQRNLQKIVRVPEAEPVHEIPEAPTAPAAPPRASGTSGSDETASKW
jgi:membrane protein implicated in regulation of membrane protease activity